MSAETVGHSNKYIIRDDMIIALLLYDCDVWQCLASNYNW